VIAALRRCALASLVWTLPSASLLALDVVPAPPPARIVNGTPTTDYPAVGMLIVTDKLCSATLIGCSTILTAAHCFCAPANTFQQCQRAGLPDPSQVLFLSQYAPPVQASRIAIHPDYNFAHAGDVAVVTLAQPVTGVAPVPINRNERPAVGTTGTIVGFGRTGGTQSQSPEVGIKRAAAIQTATCPSSSGNEAGIPAMNHLCFHVFSSSDAGTCNGDSGGPLFADLGDGPVVAGVASGIEENRTDCLPTAIDFDTDVYRYRAFVEQQLGDDTQLPCGDLPTVGAAGTSVIAAQASVQVGADFHTIIEVPAGVSVLRVVMNGELVTPDGANNFDLFVNRGAPASAAANLCADTIPAAFGVCELRDPQPGTWYITVAAVVGAGQFQLTSTLFGVDHPSCAGDCDGDGVVTINELILAVTAATTGDVSICPAIDLDGDGTVRIEELIAAVDAAQRGCGAALRAG
jgi:hypothetical protein